MANEGSSNTAIVVVFLAVLALAVGAFFAYQGGYFQSNSPKINVDVKIPAPSAPSAPAAP